MSLIKKIRDKFRAWTASNFDAAERYRAERKLLKDAKDEVLQNELAIARADQLLLRDRLAKLDKNLDEAEKKR